MKEEEFFDSVEEYNQIINEEKWLSFELCKQRGLIPKSWDWKDVEINFPTTHYNSKLEILRLPEVPPSS